MPAAFEQIVVITDPGHARSSVSLNQAAGSVIMAFSVEAYKAVEQLGMPCKFPGDISTLPDFNRIGRDNYRRAKDICSLLDDRLSEQFSGLQKEALRPMSAALFPVKVFLDALYTSHQVLKGLYKEAQHSKWIVLCSADTEYSGVVSGRTDLAPLLIEEVFAPRHSRTSIHKEKVGRCSCLNPGGLPEAVTDFARLFRRRSSGKGALTANGLVLNYRYDVPYVTDQIVTDVTFYKMTSNDWFSAISAVNAADFKVKFHASGSKLYATQLKRLLQAVAESPVYRSLFGEDEDLFMFAHKCLSAYLLRHLPSLLQAEPALRKLLQALAPEMLLTATCRRHFIEAFFLEIARSLRVPIVAYQEGGGAGYIEWPLFDMDLERADYFLVYGEGVKKGLSEQKKHAEVVVSGSLYLDQVKKRQGSPKPAAGSPTVFVIMDNIKTGTYQHYPSNGGFFSEAYRHQEEIIKALGGFADASFVVKTVPGREALYQSLVKGQNIRMDTRPLSIILGEADAFVLDYPSTVLQECLMTGKPITLLYDKDAVSLNPDAVGSLGKRIRLCNERADFREAIRGLLSEIKQTDSGALSEEFIKAYCLREDSEELLRGFFSGLREMQSHKAH